MNTSIEQKREPAVRWIITGTLTTNSNLHIGSGVIKIDRRLIHDNNEPDNDKSDDECGMAARIIRDHKGKPYLPGSAIKGVLRHHAQTFNLAPAVFQKIFGKHGNNHKDHHAGFVDFLPAWLHSAPPVKKVPEEGMPHYESSHASGLIAAAARDRATLTPADKKLFHYEAVPVGAVFEVKLHAEGLTEDEISILLGLMQGFSNQPDTLCLGAKQASGLGQMTWEKKCVQHLSQDAARQWWKDFLQKGKISWQKEEYAKPINLQAIPPTAVTNPKPLIISTAIIIDGPFLINEPAHSGKKNADQEQEWMPRRTQDGKIELPGSSLHGALRAQAERICRTLGLVIPQGHLAPVYRAKNTNLDIVSWLFGAPGWCSVLKVSSFTAEAASLHSQDFVAIDRFHGGVSGSSKFKGKAALNPELNGILQVDMHRLENLDFLNRNAALGLLALTLRDLDEGDIPLGYGAAAKGYGQVNETETATLKSFADALDKQGIQVTDLVDAFREYCKSRSTEIPVGWKHGLDASSQSGGNSKQNFSIGQSRPQGKNLFHNPYAFLPVDTPLDQGSWKNRADFDNGNLGHHSHDRYAIQDQQGTPFYSGRIICSLENQTPLIVGGKRDDRTSPPTIYPFKLDKEIALPATSLRGMIGAIIEAASQSSLRVLEDRQLSVRKPMNKALSAMGRIVEYNGKLRLEPLSLPTLRFNPGDTKTHLHDSFRKMFPDGSHASFKALFANQHTSNPTQITFFSGHAAKPASSLVPYFLNVPEITIKKNGVIDFSAHKNELHIKNSTNSKNPCQILGFLTQATTLPQSAPTQLEQVSGIIRVMHHVDREKNLPKPRKHEVWLRMTPMQLNLPITYTDTDPNSPTTDKEITDYFLNRTFEIDPAAIKCFEQLADERTESQDNDTPTNSELLPYHPIGTQRNSGNVQSASRTFKKKDRALRIKPGDIVYFNPSDDGLKVAEIAFTSIWRDRVESEGSPYSVHSFFQNIDPELLPFNPERKKISPAEWMLGFASVDNNSGNSKTQTIKYPAEKNSLSSYASKLRISFGRLALLNAAPCEQAAIPLKILASPKLPSPAMYFKPENSQQGAYVRKSELSQNPKEFRPNGRKIYLHALRKDGSVVKLNKYGQEAQHGVKDPWKTHHDGENNSQKVHVVPVAKGTRFWFHIDFNNLDRQELELLCFALQPCDQYEHRLGMGKPLGLGSVQLRPESMLLIDRAARYERDFCSSDTPRYHAVWKRTPAQQQTSDIPSRYLAALQSTSVKGYGSLPDVSSLANAGAVEVRKLSEALWRAIQITGHPDAVIFPVHTPQVSNQDIEQETFNWFTLNDKKDTTNPQSLTSMTDTSRSLPVLERR